MKEMNQKMGTHKFRFSDIMPNSWLYKLKGISRSTRKHSPSSPKHLSSSSDASSSRKLRDTLRLSSPAHRHQSSSSSSSPLKSHFKRKIKRKTIYKPSSRLKLSSSSSLNSHVSLTPSRNHRSKSSSANVITLDPSLNSHASLISSQDHRSNSSSSNAISDSALGSSSDHVVSSSPSDQNYRHIKGDLCARKLNDVSEHSPISANSSPVRSETLKESTLDARTHQKLKKPSAGSPRIKIRMNSPKIARKKTKVRTSSEPKKKGIPESFAIVLTSVDPERDFRESMVEMIVENKMKKQKDLEDLLACYLSLNSSEYHDIIIKAFEKTWLHLTHLS